MRRGEVWWADLGPFRPREQTGHRPVVIWQSNALTSILQSVLVIPLTTNLDRANLAGTATVHASPEAPGHFPGGQPGPGQEDARRIAGHELHLVQQGLEPDDWKAMAGVGPLPESHGTHFPAAGQSRKPPVPQTGSRSYGGVQRPSDE